MKIYVVDFEEVLKNFSPYHESLKKIQSEKLKFSESIDKIKTEMEGIIKSSKSLILDDKTQANNAMRFKELQSDGIKLESEFRGDIVELQNKELEDNFKQISDIVSAWAKNGDIDIIVNKSQIIFAKDEFDATSSVVDLLKDKELYTKYKEEELLEG